MLFTRLVDLWHFADVLRECSPAEQIQIVQRVGYLNSIYTNRRDLAHLHGLCFIIHLSIEEVLLMTSRVAIHCLAQSSASAFRFWVFCFKWNGWDEHNAPGRCRPCLT